MSALSALSAPFRCVTCRRATQTPPWCPSCDPTSHPPSPPTCRRCGDARRHRHCPFAASPITGLVALGPYDGPLGDAVRTAKAAGAWAGWERLGEALGRGVADALGAAPPDAVTWVPADRRRHRRRGRDHAADLARRVADHLGAPLCHLLSAAPRHHDQADLGATARRNLAADAYLSRGAAPARVLLVDDVVATGATALVCARALSRAGARAVVVAAVCRAGSGPSGPPTPPKLA